MIASHLWLAAPTLPVTIFILARLLYLLYFGLLSNYILSFPGDIQLEQEGLSDVYDPQVWGPL